MSKGQLKKEGDRSKSTNPTYLSARSWDQAFDIIFIEFLQNLFREL